MIDFSCRVCGVQCAIKPVDGPAVCEAHCDDHEYRYEGAEGHRCAHCHKQRPDDYGDEP